MRNLGGGLELAARSLVLPWMLGLRWASRLGDTDRDGMPASPRTLALAAKIAADDFFFATEVLSSSIVLRGDDRRRVRRELAAATQLFERRGWLDQPAEYHRTPPPLRQVAERPTRIGTTRYQMLAFESGYMPRPDEPGCERWLAYEPNHTAYARVLRHSGAPRPWVVCVPGYRMGNPAVDFTGFRASWLHRALGLNVAIFVHPFHGPRRVGRRGGDGYLRGDMLDTVHALSQAIRDLRRLTGWLRSQGAPGIAAYGLSLGGYSAALLAALSDQLDAVVAGIPASCFVNLVRANAPVGVVPIADLIGFPFEEVERVLSVVSPLAIPAQVPRERRFLFAGTADRLATPDQTWALWRHWERPRVAWYAGSHTSFLLEPTVTTLLEEALDPAALVRPPPEPPRTRPVRRSSALGSSDPPQPTL